MDKSTDAANMTQPDTLLRHIHGKYNVIEETASLGHLKDIAKSRGRCETLKDTLKWFSLSTVSIPGG